MALSWRHGKEDSQLVGPACMPEPMEERRGCGHMRPARVPECLLPTYVSSVYTVHVHTWPPQQRWTVGLASMHAIVGINLQYVPTTYTYVGTY